MSYVISVIDYTYYGPKTIEVFTVSSIEDALIHVRTYLTLGYVVKVGTRISE